MRKNVRTIIYLMILVIVAGGIYLWSQGADDEGILEGLDPKSYDVETTCSGVEDHILICNASSDTYLYLDDVRVFRQISNTVVDAEGIETTDISYKNSSISDLNKEIGKNGEASILLWLTAGGKVEAVIISESTYQNDNASLKELEGLDPTSYTTGSVILSVNRNGMRLGPANYSAAEADKFEGFIDDYEFADDVRFYKEVITYTVGDNAEYVKNIRYTKYTYRQLRDSLSWDDNAYIWMDDYGKISAVIVTTERYVKA